MSMYIRIKRNNQTLFLHVESSNNFLEIKKRIAVNYVVDPSQIMLLGNDKVSTVQHVFMTEWLMNCT
jgi:hypothetical protein